jgi:putative CocE/NonD family hydrolase
MKAAMIATGPHDFSEFIWGSGAFSSETIAWSHLNQILNSGAGFISIMLYMRSQKTQLRPVYDVVPLLGSVDKLFGGTAPDALRLMITTGDRSDEVWKASQFGEALDKANIPIFLITGWYDYNLAQVITQYMKLSARGINVSLLVGPWTHLSCQRNSIKEQTQFLSEHLAGRTDAGQQSPVRIFVTGHEQWRDLPSWPPKHSSHELFLSPDSKLSTEAPSATTGSSVFDFDLTQPTPSIGVPEMFAGSKDNEDTALATRSDVVTFTTTPLDRDLEVCGKAIVELHHSSSHPYVDLLVLLSEVENSGASYSIAERYIRLDVHRDQQEPLSLALKDCAHNFRKGNRIRLLIAGSSHPRYIRNLGTGENPGTGSELRPARHTINHNAAAISKLVLPMTA